MTNNMEKLYELAGIEKRFKAYTEDGIVKYFHTLDEIIKSNIYYRPDMYCRDLDDDAKEYPPFTDTKQLELESYIFQLNYGYCQLERHLDVNFENGKVKNHFFVWIYRIGDIGYIDEEIGVSYDDYDIEYHNTDRKQALAGLVCELWEDLTDEQKQEIRKILE